ncbi:MAG TPA: APC family permease [Gaiellaceae bacterium]|nr:APC family permease [Gaiellaceae bacterium]
MSIQASPAAVKRALIGPPRASGEMHKTLLSKKLALPIFASDPLSSVAYATEAALVVLVAASVSAAHLVLPISVAIAVVLAIVVLSYTQTVRAYETSGGAYVVAKENLGQLPSLVAAAALLVDYVLTVAVSVAAGVLALSSAAPSFESHKVTLSLAFIALITLVNLRGVRESGALFALPTYAFVAAMYVMVATGIGRCADGVCPQTHVVDPVTVGAGTVGVLVLLRAFASGAAALTGVEAISNGVSAFRPPEGRNAARTLLVMGAIAITLFVGVSYLAVVMHARPSESTSLISEIARATFPAGSAVSPLYYAVQALTFGILILAANTSYQGFPRLAAVLARDGFFPRQFVNLGDRLVYSNGVIVLAAIASLLIWIFHADVISLIHLYVVGVFTAFTLSQAGMVRYWFRRQEPGWRRHAVINATGASATGVVTLLVIEAKFGAGAWMVVIAVPLLISFFLLVHRHYGIVGRRLRAGAAAVRAVTEPTNEVVVYVEKLDPATRQAAWYAREIAGRDFHPLWVRDGGHQPDPRGRWWDFSGGGTAIEALDVHESPVDAILDYVWALPRGDSSFVTVVVPERFRRPSLLAAVAHRRTFRLKLRLLSEPGIVVTNIPVVDGPRVDPGRVVGRVLVSGVQAASLRAVNYARSLGLPDSRAVFFAFDEDEAKTMERDWNRADLDFPLDIVEAPYRDLGDPLLFYLRELTKDPELAVSVVMPELVVSGWRRLLHNQRALYLKRLLIFEPRIFLSSVPYHLP